MKRRREESQSEQETSRPCLDTEFNSDADTEEEIQEKDVLKHLQSNLKLNNNQFNEYINKRLFQTQKQFFRVHLEKIMKEVPMGFEIVKIVKSLEKDCDGFEVMYTAAKTLVQSQTKVIYMKSFDAVFNMVHSLICRYVHEKLVTPVLLKQCNTSEEQLSRAFQVYQKHSQADDNKALLELQCLLYTIQEVLDKNETVKIPNPVVSRCTQQMKAVAEYVVSLMLTVTKGYPDLEKENGTPAQ